MRDERDPLLESMDTDGNAFDVDELDRATWALLGVEPTDDDWRSRLHDYWIEADRRMDAEVRLAEAGYLGGRGR